VFGGITLKITDEARNLALSMLLGDGYIDRKNLFILHSDAQLDYLQWKRSLLIENGVECNPIHYKSNNGFDAYCFRTKPYHFFSLYKSILYKPNKIISNRNILNKLTPLGLAIWYMDDGGLSQLKRNGKVRANDLMLNTHLSKEDNQVIIDYFLDVWNIRFTQVKNRGKYRLRCGTKEARKFLTIVEQYVKQVPSMSHKTNIKM
jgi:hypothetical protein